MIYTLEDLLEIALDQWQTELHILVIQKTGEIVLHIREHFIDMTFAPVFVRIYKENLRIAAVRDEERYHLSMPQHNSRQ
jgi:hypothetical protein